MLTRETRTQFKSLLDAVTLKQADDTAAIIYLAPDHDLFIVTRSQFDLMTRLFSASLTGLGIKAGDLVVIAHTQGLESIYLFWAALQVGAVPSMFPTLTEKLDPTVYAQQVAALVKQSGVRAVFTADDFVSMLEGIVTCDVYNTSNVHAASATNLTPPHLHHPMPHDVAFLQHSSGTTGLQKGVALSHGAVLNQLAAYADALDLRADDVVVSWLPLYHDMGLIAGFLLPLMQGIPLVIMSPFDWVKRPAMLLRAIDQYKGTLCWLPNFAYNHMARRVRDRDIDGLRLDTMRVFVNCSEPVRDASHAQFVERFGALGVRDDMLTVSYAMAENTFAVTQSPIGQPARRDVIDRDKLTRDKQAVPIADDAPNALVQVACGAPIMGAAVRVVDADGAILPERQVGELQVKSDSMLTGYHNRPDLQPFTEDGWYKTGDMGYMADGEVFVVGRQKDLIINAGKNVYPQDIEAIVSDVDGVKDGRVAVFGVWDEREGTEQIAVVAEVTTDDREQRGAISRAIRQTVARQTTVSVSYVSLVDAKWLLKTSSGKVARAANRDKWLRERENR